MNTNNLIDIKNTTTQAYIISVRYDWSQLGESELNNDGKRTISVTTRIQ